jgi:hypothetical protein
MRFCILKPNSILRVLIAVAILFPGCFLSQKSMAPLRQVRFMENKGQLADMQGNLVPFVFFKASAPGLDLYVTDKGLTYSFFKPEEKEEKKENGQGHLPENNEYEWEVVNLDLKGATIRKENIQLEELQQGENHFYTEHFPDGTPLAHEYGKIILKEIYPGIDWVLYNTSKGGFKYDFVLNPGADVRNIQLSYSGISEAKLSPSGSIVTQTRFGNLQEYKPTSYLYKDGSFVKSSFVLLSREINDKYSTVVFGLELGERFVKQKVIIDPQLTWSTFYGGSLYEGTGVTEVDGNGNLFACGYGASTNFPFFDGGTYFEGIGLGSQLSFVFKFSSAGVLLWSTNYSGTFSHADLELDLNGNIFLTGLSTGGLPVQNNNSYFQSSKAGGIYDAYLLKFDNAGNRLWATYFGGSGDDDGRCLAIDQAGNVFLAGNTNSSNFPLMNANTYFVSTMPANPAFVAKFDNNGSLLWSTYFSNLTPRNAKTDFAGNLLLTGIGYDGMPSLNPGSGAYFQGSFAGGQDAVVIKFSNTGLLKWSTFFGGTQNDVGGSILSDPSGRIFLLGTTWSADLPVQNAGGYFKSSPFGDEDIFVSRFGINGNLEWSTYFGGDSTEENNISDNLAIDSCNNLYTSFHTFSDDIQTVSACDGGYLNNIPDQVNSDMFIVEFNSATQVSWATYLGGNGHDFNASVAVDNKNNLFVTGEWSMINVSGSANYPLVSPGITGFLDSTQNGSDDICIVRFSPGAPLQQFSYDSPLCTSFVTVVPNSSSLASGGLFSSTPGLSINPVSGIIYSSASLPGTYTVNYTGGNSSCSCSHATFVTTSNTTLQLLSGPTLSIAGSNTPCVGQVVTRTVSGASSYSWSTGSSSSTLSFSPSKTTVLTVTGTAANGCKAVKTVQISVKNCTGIDEETLRGISVYPNPNSGSFIIDAKREAELVLMNMIGQNVRTIKISKDQEQIKDLPNGVYILKDLRSDSGAGIRIVVD